MRLYFLALLCAPILLSCSAKPVGYLKRQVERDGTRVLVRGIDPDTLIQRKYEFTTAGHQRQIEQLRQVKQQLTEQMKQNEELAEQHSQHLATSIQNIHITRLNAQKKAMVYEDHATHSLKASVRLDGVVFNELEFQIKVADANKFILASTQSRKDNMLYDLKLRCHNTSCRRIDGWLQQRPKHKPGEVYAASVFYYHISRPYVKLVRGRSNKEQRSRVFYDLEQAQAKNHLKVERKVWQVIDGVSATEVQLRHPAKKDNIFRLQADVVDTHDHAIEAQIKISPTYFKGLDVKAQLAFLNARSGDMAFDLSVARGEDVSTGRNTSGGGEKKKGTHDQKIQSVLIDEFDFRGPPQSIEFVEKGVLIERVRFNISNAKPRQRPKHNVVLRPPPKNEEPKNDKLEVPQDDSAVKPGAGKDDNKKRDENKKTDEDTAPKPGRPTPPRHLPAVPGEELEQSEDTAPISTPGGDEAVVGNVLLTIPAYSSQKNELLRQKLKKSIFTFNTNPDTHIESWAALQDFEFYETNDHIQQALKRLKGQDLRARTVKYLKHLPYVAPLLESFFQSEDVLVTMANLLYLESNCVSGGFNVSAETPDDREDCRARSNESSAGGAFQILDGTAAGVNKGGFRKQLHICDNPNAKWRGGKIVYHPQESKDREWCKCEGAAKGTCDARYHFDSNALLSARVLRSKIDAMKKIYEANVGWSLENFDYTLAVAAYYIGPGRIEEGKNGEEINGLHELLRDAQTQSQSQSRYREFSPDLQILLDYNLLGDKYNDITERVAMHFITTRPLEYGFTPEEIRPFTSPQEKKKIEARVQKLFIPKNQVPVQTQCPRKTVMPCSDAQCRLCRLHSFPSSGYSVPEEQLTRHL